MTDKDTIEDLKSVFNSGTINLRPGRQGNKDSWIWSVQKQVDIFNVLLRVLPYLRTRRREKALELFDFLEPKVCR